jgi:hypothetical protein
MSELPRTVHCPLSTLSPEQARDARARAWAYVFVCFNRRNGKEAAHPGSPDDARKDKDARTYPYST